MKAVSGTRMAHLVEDKGWRLARINGSHHIYMNDERMDRLVIPEIRRRNRSCPETNRRVIS